VASRCCLGCGIAADDWVCCPRGCAATRIASGGAEVHREQRAPTREGNPAHGTGDGAHDCHPTTLEEAGNVVHDHNLKFTLL